MAVHATRAFDHEKHLLEKRDGPFGFIVDGVELVSCAQAIYSFGIDRASPKNAGHGQFSKSVHGSGSVRGQEGQGGHVCTG